MKKLINTFEIKLYIFSNNKSFLIFLIISKSQSKFGQLNLKNSKHN